jgi:hypothetical protein
MTAKITGLETISSIFAMLHDSKKACLYIEQLSDKQIKISELTTECKILDNKMNDNDLANSRSTQTTALPPIETCLENLSSLINL